MNLGQVNTILNPQQKKSPPGFYDFVIMELSLVDLMERRYDKAALAPYEAASDELHGTAGNAF